MRHSTKLSQPGLRAHGHLCLAALLVLVISAGIAIATERAASSSSDAGVPSSGTNSSTTATPMRIGHRRIKGFLHPVLTDSWTMAALFHDPSLPPPPSAASITGTVQIDDCNDPESPLPTWICREFPKDLRPPDYPYYVGHDEPEMQFYSNTPGSGNNVQWKIKLPAADPTPDQAGTKVTNRELYPTFWFSMALCDPQATPFGACTPNSDSNTFARGKSGDEQDLRL